MNQHIKTNNSAKLYKLHRTKNRRLILNALLNQTPLTTRQLHEALNSQDKIPSLLQTYRTMRQLAEGDVIKREKQRGIFHYSYQ
jgi:Fe2+ or Zn2+ uptake regulation protein